MTLDDYGMNRDCGLNCKLSMKVIIIMPDTIIAQL